MIINEEDYIAHIGTPRHSGRYPWGSGGTENQKNKSLLDYDADLKRQGIKEVDRAKGLGLTVANLRAKKSIAHAALKQADANMAQRLEAKGMSRTEIGKRMAIDGKPRNESTVRGLLKAAKEDKANILVETAAMLKKEVDERGFMQIGTGVENHLGISQTKLATAAFLLEEKGYRIHTVLVDQQTSPNKTKMKVLCPPGTEYNDVKNNIDKIQTLFPYSEDGGRRWTLNIAPPISVDLKRIAVRYAENGGDKADGIIYVRPGAKDLSLGKARYAQVRIKVNDEHYLKGMAMFKDDLPPGIDLEFNTKKSDSGNKLDAMKSMARDKDGKLDPDNPFGSVVRQIFKKDKDGNDTDVLASAMNLVNEEGDWEEWNKNLSSQMLSKQPPTLAKEQLAKTVISKQKDFDEIMALTNPSVRQKLLESFADDVDKSSVHLKAYPLNRQGSHVILPINSMKETEIYAPKFNNGERVVLIRYPHGGIFEIPELTVNNKHPQARKLLGDNPQDAVGINSKVALRLSGADFDGDTVLVIPNGGDRKIKTSPAIASLMKFDPIREYPPFEGMPLMTVAGKGYHMGVISNLITDMTIKKASTDELTRAVKHSMVVIDAEKHKLNYKQSALDNNIKLLKVRYQNSSRGGASTLISQRKSPKPVPKRMVRRARNGGPVDPKTGKKMYEPVLPQSYVKDGKTIHLTSKTTKLADTDDAHTLSSGTLIEKVYADHSNKLKDMANVARREAVNTKTIPYDSSANKVYAREVVSLNAKLNEAMKNRPLERQAQVFAGITIKMKTDANPELLYNKEHNAELKKLRYLAIEAARKRTGAQSYKIVIEPNEWDAIQAGAIHNNKLKEILKKADLKRIKELATPREHELMSSAKQRRAQNMFDNGATQAEVAGALGVSLSTLKRSLKGE